MGELGSVLSAVGIADERPPLSVGAFARLAARGSRREFARGAELMHQGDEASSLFILLEGTVGVLRDHPQLSAPILLASLGPGEIVGEMGLLDGEPRSATVTAVEDTVALEVSASDVRACTSADPELYRALVMVLTRRLRSTNELVARTGVERPAGRPDVRRNADVIGAEGGTRP